MADTRMPVIGDHVEITKGSCKGFEGVVKAVEPPFIDVVANDGERIRFEIHGEVDV